MLSKILEEYDTEVGTGLDSNPAYKKRVRDFISQSIEQALNEERAKLIKEIEEKIETLTNYGRVNNGTERVDMLAKSEVKSLINSLK
jgi:fumarate hydratase class II